MTAAKKINPQIMPKAMLLIEHSTHEQAQVSKLLNELGCNGIYIEDLATGLSEAAQPETFFIVVDTTQSKFTQLFKDIRPSLNRKVKWVFVISPKLSPSKVSSFYNLGAMNVINAPLHPLVLQMQVRQALKTFAEKPAIPVRPKLQVLPHIEKEQTPRTDLTLDYFLDSAERKNLLRTKNLFIKEEAQIYEPIESKKIVRAYYDLSATFNTPIVLWNSGQEEVLVTRLKGITRWLGSATLHNPDRAFFTSEEDTLFANIRLGPVTTFSKVKMIRGDYNSYDLKIELPESAYKLQRRKQLRTSLKIQPTAEVQLSKETHSAKLMDIGTGGCQLQSFDLIQSTNLKKGFPTWIRFQLGATNFSLGATISWVNTHAGTVGLKFEGLNLTEHSQIEAFVYQDSQDLFEASLKRLY